MVEKLTLSTSASHLDRLEEQRHTTPDFPFRVCQDFWFSDGNVILSAGSFAFKVHRGQLERHAEIFQTMLSIPQPENADSTINLCDSPTDVYHLLRALYDGLYFRQPFVQDFPFLASVLRLSCKYFICIPRRQCLERLQTYFPATLAEWDRRERMSLAPDGHYDPRHEIPSPIHVINLARELNVGSILPAAFYDLARYGTSRIASGAEPLPHLVLEGPSSENSPVSATTTDSTHVLLSHDDLVLTFRGRETLQRSVASFLDAQVKGRAPAGGCTGGQACRDAFYFIALNTLRAVGGIAAGRDGDPLFTLAQMIDMLHHTEWVDGQFLRGLPMCGKCREEFIPAVHAGRQAIWEQIPAWFGLEPYDILKARDEELNERDMYP
ncbi:hypothetical protein DFH94DRAFT_624041 [Russula ochroleuca]|uniref:BTB domain-containing protein n=1 Tax=Russula ochroleuca TaxID=152965 RepID=A0A9P5N306_9AGAM|nr:hypothetical protein DFH94DRAFT_624041 [Russula ochroleuca]